MNKKGEIQGSVFIDTSAWIAEARTEDKNHATAEKLFKSLQNVRSIITTDLVFSETVTLLKRKSSHRVAVEFGEKLKQSNLITMVHICNDLMDEGWLSFIRYHDKAFSFVDCTSFVIMKKYGITKALAFDRNFEQAGFEILD